MSRDVDHDADETALWARVVHDEQQAFGEVFTRYADLVYAHCFRRTADRSASEDLTSLVFLHAWRRRHRDRPEALLPWLLGMANNLLRNHARTLRRQHRLVERLSVPDGIVPDGGADPGDQVVERLDEARRMRAVLAALGRLPRGTREVIELVVWDGLTYEQAALALDIPVGTVRSRLSRARARLQGLADPAPDTDRDTGPRGARDGSHHARGGTRGPAGPGHRAPDRRPTPNSGPETHPVTLP